MKQLNRSHAILSATGLVAWMLYILGCGGWASWDPAGKRLLIPSVDPETKSAFILLLDREDGSTRPIFALPAAGSDPPYVFAQWESTGRRAVIVRKGEDSVEVIVLPIASDEPALHFQLPDAEAVNIPPLPELDAHLYVGGDYVARLDLRSGESVVRGVSSGVGYLAACKGRIFYLREVPSRESPDEPEGADAIEAANEELEEEQERPAEERFEVGIVGTDEEQWAEKPAADKTESGAAPLTPLFQIDWLELEKQGLGDLLPFLALDPTGTRMALVAEGNPRGFLLLLSLSGVERVFSPGFAAERFLLGRPQWSKDGKTLYVSVLATTADEGVLQYSLGEIPLDAAPPRLTPIAEIQANHPDEFELFLQLSLSPDGDTIATSTAYLPNDNVSDEARGLYLVDLRDPARPVTRVPLSRTAQPAAKLEED